MPLKHIAMQLSAALACMAFAREASANDSPPPTQAQPQSLDFDSDTLKQRGIDPRLAVYFREAPRFPGGTHRVTLIVNGRGRGQFDVPFHDDGTPCFDPALLDRARLVIPEKNLAATKMKANDSTCVDLLAAWPQTRMDLRPGKNEIELIVPTDALREPEQKDIEYATGGMAALANYDILATNSRFGGRPNNSLSAITELGFNAHDWIVRSRQSFNVENGRTQTQQLLTYAQHTFTRQSTVLQLGQVDLNNPLFVSGPFEGIQILPEAALLSPAGGGIAVEGIAHTQARVEVRQNGALIYNTLVPPGPFSLRDVSLLNGSSPLEVTVIEGDGSQQRFTVSAADLLRPSLAPVGFSFAAGRLRSFGLVDRNQQPWLMSAARGWSLGPQTRVIGGAMAANNNYQSLGYGVDTSAASSTWILSYRQALSQTTQQHASGVQTTLSLGASLPYGLTATTSALTSTRGYRDLTDTMWTNARGADPASTIETDSLDRTNRQYSASLTWNHPDVGGFNLNYSRYSLHDGAYGQRTILTWSKTFDRANLSVSGEWNSGVRTASYGQRDGNAIYATLSFPLGRDNVRLTANQRDGQQQFGANYYGQVNDQLNYNAAVQRNQAQGTTDFSAGANLLPRYAQTSMTYSRYGSGGSLYTGGIRGGIVASSQGIALSPYPVQDTFGIVSLDDPQAGVKISTPAGPVWTDAWGHAAVSQLSAYQSSQVDLIAKTLPRDADVNNSIKTVEAGRGSVQQLHFGVVRTRRVLLHVTTENDQPLTKGNTVVNGADQFVTAVGNDGEVFLSGVPHDSTLKSIDHDDQPCRLIFTLPAKPADDSYFERVEAQCKRL